MNEFEKQEAAIRRYYTAQKFEIKSLKYGGDGSYLIKFAKGPYGLSKLQLRKETVLKMIEKGWHERDA